MSVTDDILSAFLDGELPADQLKRIAKEIDADPALRQRAEALAAPDAILQKAYRTIDDDPMPDAVLALLEDADDASAQSNVVAFKSRVMRQREIWRLPIAASIALAAGLALGLSLSPNESVQIAGAVKPGEALFAALETSPSGETRALDNGRAAAMVLTFKAGETWCREFTVAAADAGVRAIACREDEGWAVKLAAVEAGANDGYQTAASGVSTAFDAGAVALGADDPISASREAALLENGWRANPD